MTTINGLILTEKNIGESSKSITVLTAEKGVISIFIRGGQKSKKNSSATQLFAYSILCIDEKKKPDGQTDYYLNSSESIRLFYNIRLDAKKTALAAYFSELLLFSRTEQEGYDEVMRLTLNTFYFLNEGKKPLELLKSIFELRLPCEIGLRPDLIGCTNCIKYEDDNMHFDFNNNNLICSDCYSFSDKSNDIVIDKTLLYIIRFIALTEFKRIFSFRISDKYTLLLSEFTERFIKNNFKVKLHTLDFYKMI